MKKIILLSFVLLFGLAADSVSHDATLDAYGNGGSTTQPGQRIRRGRGHDRDKERVQSGDVIHGIYGRGYTGSAFTTSDNVAVEMQAAEDWSSTANGTKVIIKTTPSGSTTAGTVGTFQPDGGFLPYSRTEAQLKVSTPTAVGALYWDSTNSQHVKSTGTTNCTDYAAASSTTTITPIGW